MATIKSLTKRLTSLEARQLAKTDADTSGVILITVPDTAEFARYPTLTEWLSKRRLQPENLVLIPDNGRGLPDPRFVVRDDQAFTSEATSNHVAQEARRTSRRASGGAARGGYDPKGGVGVPGPSTHRLAHS